MRLAKAPPPGGFSFLNVNSGCLGIPDLIDTGQKYIKKYVYALCLRILKGQILLCLR
jgi:hypothetical protein